MSISGTEQIRIFFVATLTGVVAMFLFDFFRALRLNKRPSNRALAVEDISFWICATILIIGSLFIFSSGELRIYWVLGMAIGAAIYLATISKIVIAFLDRIIRIFYIAFCGLLKAVSFPLVLFSKLVRKPILIVFTPVRSYYRKKKAILTLDIKRQLKFLRFRKNKI